jgi:iron complex transport system substrate-binding protein
VKLYYKLFFVILGFISIQCKHETKVKSLPVSLNSIQYASGFSIEKHAKYSVLKVSNPWPNASKTFTYILKKRATILPDSIEKQGIVITIPIKRIIVTSTTHIPSLVLLNEEKTLVGFPKLDYISSPKVRTLIDKNKIAELGNNQSLNIEQVLNLQPDVLIGYGLDSDNPVLYNLEKSGLKILFNGDWNEQSPLGKAEWIKFFGALYNKLDEAEKIFLKIETDYKKTLNLVKNSTQKPTVLAGDIFEDKWYLPQGSSWGSQFINDAKGNYLWSHTKGTGSLALSFETVFEKAKNAEIWITSGQFSTLDQMKKANPHYAQFQSFKNKKVYSFNRKKGEKGGVLYYELAPNRPDIVLKDMVKILHPDLLKNYKPYFFEQLK